MTPDFVTLINLILCVVIVAVSVFGCVKIGSLTPLYIGAGFFLFGVSHVFTLLGLAGSLYTPLVVVRVLGYVIVCAGLYLTIREVILRKQTQEELEAERQGLERRVRERTAELHASNEELLASQKAMRESEGKYRAVVERARDGIGILDADRILFANESLAWMLGYPTQDLLDLPFVTFVPEEQRAQIAERVRRRIAGEEVPDAYETVLVRRDGTQFPVEVSAGRIVHAGVSADLVLIRDITARKQAAEKLARLNDQLARDAAALAEANTTIARVAATDHLTGLANRRAFHDALERAVSLATRHGSPLALAGLDLDKLKRVNDDAGHAAGDEVLKRFAQLLEASTRAEDQPARVGGDEFCVLLPGSDLGGAQRFAARALAMVRSCTMLAELGVTVSWEVAQWRAGELPDDLSRRADEALYAAKRGGGDSVATDG